MYTFLSTKAEGINIVILTKIINLVLSFFDAFLL
jgi:hypothetical protein